MLKQSVRVLWDHWELTADLASVSKMVKNAKLRVMCLLTACFFSGPSEYLVMAAGSEIRGLFLDDSTGQPFQPASGLDGAVGVDYSAEHNTVFFTEV